MPKVCDMDCLNCIYDDCINDYIRPMHVITTEEDRISNRQSRKKRYEKLKQAGLCTDCGKPAYNGSVRCFECKLKHNRISKQKYREKHPISRDVFRENGCYFCGEECVAGKKVCKKHFDICKRNAENARKSDSFKAMLIERKNKYFKG